MKIMTFLGGWLRKNYQHPVTPPRGFDPIGQFQDDDVFIAGFPKSGNTWLQLIIATMIYGLDPARSPEKLTQELVPDVHYKEFFKRFRSPTVFKTHDLPRPEHRRVINIVRDGRDVLCS